MQYRGVQIISAPYHVGEINIGVGKGPQAILDGGLTAALHGMGVATVISMVDSVQDYEGEIGRSFELMRRIANGVRSARREHMFPVVLGGNCFSSVGISAGIDDIPIDDLGMIWHDAHDDYHVPDTLSSGYFDAMGVSMLTGESWHTLVHSIPGFRPIKKTNIILCGTRDVTETERRRLNDAGFKVIWGHGADEARSGTYAEALEHALRTQSAPKHVMVHWDLDVLDADKCGKANKFAAPGGLTGRDLQDIADMLPKYTSPTSLLVASFDPACSKDDGTHIAQTAVTATCRLISSLVSQGQLLCART
ncbi:hypothetical protein BAUCODRAFT_175205 [Baudoinia panamericana UAMH 10762]|uniref:Arginase n=1 Tax=Baudoinia panamericana (strain UAMH 10762) TaxID=717646 RepID=M2M0R0_BAUPA|nr:uncharacterized protein BAUCODRAFT_175205 [Baudoinia panamericana UAMH 10762]EMD00598.1 hypothetical protein BAUCODRAFT_175205 [Baudoinia panamericana UAMH 10762]